ncbi:phage tail family protein [Nonomuraea sp. WAC 01424]|uniref:phage tail family protein n=1 Tax=Nonomuraea sp. WAC 01424 TaxID=2203200 RepID=UPI000F79C3F2|nr:phage tail family protein [Nonomuraea sp. WAC 01424]
MPIAIDGTSPAGVASPSTLTTASFTPPAGSLLVALVMTTDGTISNSGTARTWTNRKQHGTYTGLRIYTAPNPTASALTVSITGDGALKVFVVTGQNASPAGANGAGATTTNNATVNGYTSTGANSRGFVAAINWAAGGAPSSTDDEYAAFYGDFGMGMLGAVKAANSGASGSTVQFNLDADGTGAADWAWIALEILAGSTDATISVTEVGAAGEVPAPSIAAAQNATVSPAVVAAAGEVPSATVKTGQTAKPSAVDVRAEVPAPNVVAGSATLVQPSVVNASGQVPAPTVSASQAATASPTVVAGQADVPSPTVSATTAATVTPEVVEAQALVPSAGVSVPILPGTLITQDAQVEWGGTALWGTGTSYRLLEITGWDAKPQLDDLTQEEPARHGANAGVSYLQRRIVTIKLQVDALSDPTEVSGLLAQLRYDTRTLRDNTLWTLVIRGYTETLMAFGKVIDRTGVMDRDWSIGAPEPVITIMCPDPRRYSLDQHSVVIPANASSPMTLVNDGDLYTNPLLRFAGPATNPLLYNETLDRVLGFDMTLGAGELLVVDTQRGKVTIGNVDHEADISDTISVPVKEFFLDVGSNELSYETDSGGAGGVEVLWRDANE